MAYKILIQAGHQNTTNGQTGAPEEMANNIRIRDRLGQVLISKGFQVYLCDANFVGKEDYHLALSLHCDADYPNDNGSGFVDYPDPSVDSVNAESKRIKEAIESEYFKNSGINNVSHSNPNTKLYYWWSMLTAKTPCVILEMGQSVDPHDRVILADTDRVANAITRGICRAFGVAFDPVTPPTPTPTPPANTEIDTLKAQIKALQDTVDGLKKNVSDLTSANITLSNQLNDLNKNLGDAIAELNEKKAGLYLIKTIVYGKGWSWTKVDKVKAQLSQLGI
jgi:regulator of replication initiation timing